jgi:hypothetical protein
VYPLYSETFGNRVRETNEKNEALKRAQMHIRHYWSTAENKVQRLGLPAEYRAHCGLNVDGTFPHVSKEEEWLAVAERVIEGARALKEKGYPPVLDPAIEEVTEAVSEARREAAEARAADGRHDVYQEKMEVVRVAADDMFQVVANQLPIMLRKKDKSSQRRVMRNYGIGFSFSEGEPVDEALLPPTPEEGGQAS